MIKLDEILNIKKISKKIHEFAKIDVLLNDYGKKSTTTKYLNWNPIIIWRERRPRNPANKEEVNTWEHTITKIGNKIKSKEFN